MIGKPKIKVCFKCKKYITLFPDNSISQEIENKFDNKHTCHTILIICKDELDNINYERERFNKNKNKLLPMLDWMKETSQI